MSLEAAIQGRASTNYTCWTQTHSTSLALTYAATFQYHYEQ